MWIYHPWPKAINSIEKFVIFFKHDLIYNILRYRNGQCWGLLDHKLGSGKRSTWEAIWHCLFERNIIKTRRSGWAYPWRNNVWHGGGVMHPKCGVKGRSCCYHKGGNKLNRGHLGLRDLRIRGKRRRNMAHGRSQRQHREGEKTNG